MYSTDLAYIHDVGFGDAAERSAPGIARVLREHGLRPSRRGRQAPLVVEAGCGSGTLARYLVDHGYDVSGFDISPAMIRLARKKVPEARFHVGSLSDERIEPCDAVVAIGEVVTYAPALGRFFPRVHAALKPGGIFIFDFIESADRRTYSAKSRGGDDWAIVASARLDRAGRILTRRIISVRRLASKQFRRSQETHRVRIYDRREIAARLADAGFKSRMSRSYGQYRLMPGDVAVVAQRV